MNHRRIDPFDERTIKFTHFYPREDAIEHNLGNIGPGYNCCCNPIVKDGYIIHNSVTLEVKEMLKL